jgi:lipoprotein-anchoring transpeptidase ErfK/SrfK
VASVVAALAQKVDRAPADAKIEAASGTVSVLPAVPGQTLDQRAAVERVVEVGERVANEKTTVEAGGIQLPVRATQPKVTAYPDIILIRTGDNKLLHYENHVLAGTYTVATGTAQYPTPTGKFSIALKRRNPTWVNPDPGGWGRSMPASIPPGPGNPLGTRALNLTAAGIRIHGTSNVGSLGSNASHGCIRMSISDSEALFDRVETGTPVIIIRGPSAPRPAPPPAAGANPIGPIDVGSG